jgi:hypothetical protein
MSNKNLFKEAIADAKAVREAALANAKVALEEALTPKLQSMLATKLQEMEYEEEELEEKMGEEEMEEEGFATNQGGFNRIDAVSEMKKEEEEELEEDFDLSEILAELNDEEEEEDEEEELEEAKKEEEEEEEDGEEESVAEMSIEDLKALIKDIVGQEIEAEEAETPADEEAEEEAGEEKMDMSGEEMPADEESDEIDLEELLAELDALGETKEEELEEGVISKIGGAIKAGAQKASQSLGMSNPPECDQRGKEIMDLAKSKGITDLKNLSTLKWMAINECRKEKGLDPLVSHVQGRAFGATSEVKEEEKELEEAISVINTLRTELNEVNLLNAKLLYVNKIFKAKNLTESQKLTVIASFDKATTAKEAKVVFESLSANLNAAPAKKAIKESMGFASKAAGMAPKKAIVESNDIITRMQKLANIIK